MIYLRPTKVQF